MRPGDSSSWNSLSLESNESLFVDLASNFLGFEKFLYDSLSSLVPYIDSSLKMIDSLGPSQFGVSQLSLEISNLSQACTSANTTSSASSSDDSSASSSDDSSASSSDDSSSSSACSSSHSSSNDSSCTSWNSDSG